MSDEPRNLSKGNDEADKDRDPEPSEMEIDQANDTMGGPTTESHSAGLASTPRPKGELPPGAEDAKPRAE